LIRRVVASNSLQRNLRTELFPRSYLLDKLDGWLCALKFLSFSKEVFVTMKYRTLLGSSLTLALVASCLGAGETLKSGPQVGDKVPGPFNPLNVTGSAAGQKACQV
jgi:hypothetical protein